MGVEVIVFVLGVIGFSMVWCYSTPTILFRNYLIKTLPRLATYIEKTDCLPCSSFWIGILTYLIIQPPLSIMIIGVVSFIAYTLDNHTLNMK